MESVALVIPQFGQTELTIACLRSFLKHHQTCQQIIVIDDGSSPNEKRALHQLCIENLFIVPVIRNQGVTRAWNLGLRHCSSEIVVLLNNDAISSREWLSTLVAPITNNQHALCGVGLREELDLPEFILKQRTHRKILQGWCLAFRRDIASGIGEFDEQMRLYFSDTDWQCRWIEAYGPNSLINTAPLPVRHIGQQTTKRVGRRKPVWQMDRRAFVNKWRARDASVAGL